MSMMPDRFELPADGLPAARLCLAQRVPAGDPGRARAAARRSGALAAELRRTSDVLLSGVESSRWRGAAHQALLAQLRMHTPQLSATADRYDGYATALNGYAGVLDDTAGPLLAIRRQLQRRSDELTSRAGTALQSPPALPGAAAGPDPGAELLPLARAFKAGYDRWADGLDRCVRALRCVDEHDPTRDRHGFSALGHRLGHAAAAVLSPFEQAILHPSLRNISACLGDLNAGLSVLGLGLLFLCPPAAAACLAAATVLAVAQLAVDSTRRARGESVATTSLGLSSLPRSHSAATPSARCAQLRTSPTSSPAAACWPTKESTAPTPSSNTSANPSPTCATDSPPSRTSEAPPLSTTARRRRTRSPSCSTRSAPR
jgi:hypothetical protein